MKPDNQEAEGAIGRMRQFLYRFLAYLCLSLCLALAAGPYTGVTKQKGIEAARHLPRYLIGPSGSVLDGHDRAGGVALSQETKIPWFNPVRYSLSFAFLLWGLWWMRRATVSGLDISLSSPWVVFLRDGIFILFLALGVFFILDRLLAHGLRTIPLFRADRVIFNMVAIGMIPVTAFCAWFASRLNQSLRVSEKGITLMTSGESRFLPWSDIRGFDVRESRILMGGEGWAASRPLQRCLVIQTSREPSSIAEPAFKSTKKKIVEHLKATAPARLHSDLARAAHSW